MIYYYLLMLLFVNVFYGNQNNTLLEEFRQVYQSSIVAQRFEGILDAQDAKLLVGDKVKGKYVVRVTYDITEGIKLLVDSEDSFYDNLLYSYEIFINRMLLPILNSRSYIRIKDKIKISLLKKDVYCMLYKQGDSDVRYIIKMGDLGLIDHIDYYIDNKKDYALDIYWKKLEDRYLPYRIKTTAYRPTIKIVNFIINQPSLK